MKNSFLIITTLLFFVLTDCQTKQGQGDGHNNKTPTADKTSGAVGQEGKKESTPPEAPPSQKENSPPPDYTFRTKMDDGSIIIFPDGTEMDIMENAPFLDEFPKEALTPVPGAKTYMDIDFTKVDTKLKKKLFGEMKTYHGLTLDSMDKGRFSTAWQGFNRDNKVVASRLYHQGSRKVNIGQGNLYPEDCRGNRKVDIL